MERGLTEKQGSVILNNMADERITIQAKDLLSPKKAADYLDITTMTLWRWVRDGKITPVMLDHRYFHINELKRVKAIIGAKGPEGGGQGGTDATGIKPLRNESARLSDQGL